MGKYQIMLDGHKFPRIELEPGREGVVRYLEMHPARSVLCHSGGNVLLNLKKEFAEYNEEERRILAARENFPEDELEELWTKEREYRTSPKH